jgi:hypothetical protein
LLRVLLGKMSFVLFPEDTLCEILQLLQDSRNVTAFPLVCKQWNALFKTPKLARILFASLWDPERVEFDYSDVPTKKPSEIPKFSEKHRQLTQLCRKMEQMPLDAPVKQVWKSSTGYRKALCWFTANDTKHLYILQSGTVRPVLKDTAGTPSAPAAQPIRFAASIIAGEKFRMSMENRFAMWELEKETHLIELKSNNVFKTSYPSFHLPDQRSYDSTTMREYYSKETQEWVDRGKHDKGYVNSGNTDIRAGEILPGTAASGRDAKFAWNVVLKTSKMMLAGCSRSKVAVLDYNNAATAKLVFLSSENGEKISSCDLGAISTIANIPFARVYFIADTRALVVLQRSVTLLDLIDPLQPQILNQVSHNGEIFGTFCVRFNLLFIETHPEKWYLCREDSNLLVYRIGNAQLRCIRQCSGLASVNSLAVDDTLAVYGTGFDNTTCFKINIM